MLLDHLVKGFPHSEVAGVREALDRLLQRNWVIQKPTRHGTAVYINLRYKQEIEQGLRRHFPYL